MTSNAYDHLAKVYDLEWGKYSIQFLKFIDFACDKFHYSPSSVLDLACGTGNLAIALQERGLDAVGIDLSPAMIQIAQEKQTPVVFLEDNMTSFELQRTFDLVTCAFDSLNYLLDLNQVIAMFHQVQKHLSPDGMFLFDINTPMLYEHKHHGTLDRNLDGHSFLQILEYDSSQCIAHTTFRFESSAEELHIQKAYTQAEIEEALSQTQIECLAAYEDAEGTPVHAKSERIFFVGKLG